MSEYPLEIMTNILSRVPVEPLLRFRCVSKPWCSLIDSPNFVKTHLNRSIENHTNLTLILGENDPDSYNKTTLHSFDLDTLRTPIAFNNYFKNYDVLGSSNGLLLLKAPHHHQLVLFNPSMRRYQIVPTTPVGYHPLDGSIDTLFTKMWLNVQKKKEEEKCGLGYDSINDDYKVIRLFEIYESFTWVKTEAKVYSLKLNLWRKIQDFPYCVPVYGGWGAPVNGTLHMLVRESYNCGLSNLIASFDVRDEKFYLVPKPDFLDERDVKMSVDVLGGCLCLTNSYGDYTDLWVMKVYGVKKSWMKLLSISSPEVGYYVPLRTLGYSKSSDEVLLNFVGKKLIWYDLKRREIRTAELWDFSRMFCVEVCVGSLVPLAGYGETEELKKQHMEEKKEATEE